MTQLFSDFFSFKRKAAIELATSVLVDAGFVLDTNQRWKGKTPKGHSVEIEIPPQFPDQLPVIWRLDTSQMQVAHVSPSNKLCLAPESGTLLDTARPTDLLLDAFERADQILGANRSESSREIEREFEAYWAEVVPFEIISICAPRSDSGPVWSMELDSPTRLILVGPNSSEVTKWANSVGKVTSRQREAFFVRVARSLTLPRLDNPLSLRKLLRLVEQAGPKSAAIELTEWLLRNGLPATILISAPILESDNVVISVHIPTLVGTELAKAERGFRSGKLPDRLIVRRAMNSPTNRTSVERGDPEFLLPRGGASLILFDKRVAVVGCGAVGSFTASSLAASGVGQLILVDPEKLRMANIHRHLLGAAHVGRLKVEAIAEVLLARFPHLSVTSIAANVEVSLESSNSPILQADLIVFALGMENLELQLNSFLKNGPTRVHVWLEPLGVGGHVLRVGTTGETKFSGCYECLFRFDSLEGLTNMSSFVSPNQDFHTTIGGCAGTYTAFGAIDAERAGIEAAKEVITCLTLDDCETQLTSWLVSKAAIMNAGYRLSPRGLSFTDESLVRRRDVARADCPICFGGNQ